MARRIRTATEAVSGRYNIDPVTGCWLWAGKPDSAGYGTVKIGGRGAAPRRVHVVMYELLVGPVPDGKELDHLCRVLICCNPEHLEPVPHRTNIRRGDSPAGLNSRKTHCPQGHPYDDINTYFRPDGKGRGCLTCRRDRDAARRR